MTLAIPALGYGAAALGNLYRAIGDEEARAVVDAAWAAGIRHVDVTPRDGLGVAESRLGHAAAPETLGAELAETLGGGPPAPADR